jgi:hypothetical protein
LPGRYSLLARKLKRAEAANSLAFYLIFLEKKKQAGLSKLRVVASQLVKRGSFGQIISRLKNFRPLGFYNKATLFPVLLLYLFNFYF